MPRFNHHTQISRIAFVIVRILKRKAHEESRRVRNALEFYSDFANWDSPAPGEKPPAEKDRGNLAREARTAEPTTRRKDKPMSG